MRTGAKHQGTLEILSVRRHPNPRPCSDLIGPAQHVPASIGPPFRPFDGLLHATRAGNCTAQRSEGPPWQLRCRGACFVDNITGRAGFAERPLWQEKAGPEGTRPSDLLSTTRGGCGPRFAVEKKTTLRRPPLILVVLRCAQALWTFGGSHASATHKPVVGRPPTCPPYGRTTGAVGGSRPVVGRPPTCPPCAASLHSCAPYGREPRGKLRATRRVAPGRGTHYLRRSLARFTRSLRTAQGLGTSPVSHSRPPGASGHR